MYRIFKIFGVLFIFTSVLFLSGCGIKSSPEAYKIDLEVWGVFDDSDAYADIIGEYAKLNPYVETITYRKLQPETYKEELLNALAAGKGPDVFMIRNSWVPSFQDKISPAPERMTEKDFKDAFVDVAAYDFIGSDKKIYGAPLSVDSLALYYNKDLFNAAGIATPPATWEEAAQDVSQLTQVDQTGNIRQSGIALGTAQNINRSTDILGAMMFQLGSTLADPQSGRINLTEEAALGAADFYTQFSRIDSPYYTWNPRQHYSIDAFYEGTLGMMVNYSWQYPVIKQKNAKLNIGIAPLPQFAKAATKSNYANYWGYAVTRNKEYVATGQNAAPVDKDKQNAARIHEAWQFLRYFAYPHPEKMVTLENALSGTTKDFPLTFDPAERYLEKTKKPAARRDLIEKQKTNTVLAPFATGNLIAKNWHQSNPEQIETILAETIDSIARGEKASFDALGLAANRINLLLKP